METQSPPLLVGQELLRLMELAESADSLELKLTVPELSYRSTVAALGLDPLEAQIRQVFFFDTPDLALNEAGVVLRARRIQARDSDTVVKLRPVLPHEMPSELRKSPNFGIEVDAMPGGYVCSASLKGKLPPTAVPRAVAGEKPLHKLFSKEQRNFFAVHAPSGLSIDDLSVLGPIFVLKLKVIPAAISRRIVAELWLYPDGSRVLELSTKCLPHEGVMVATQVRGFLESKGVDTGGVQQTKTKQALEFFASELRSSAVRR